MTLNEFSQDSSIHNILPFNSNDQIVHDWLKRGFDILLSCAALSFGLPLLLLIAIMVKCTSHGPIFYCSLRLGRNGKLFKFWKFRSMYKDANQKLEQLLKTNSELNKEWKIYFKLKNDPRIL
jgi:exopolysaccharide production protein ExoY